MKEQIILIGGGGHCKSVIDVIEKEAKFEISGIVDFKDKIGIKNLNYPIIAEDDDLIKLTKEFHNFFITIGFIKAPKRRIEIFNLLNSTGANFPSIISPYAYVSNHSQIGKGTVIMHHAQVNAGANIGENCIINSKALIEHDAHVGNHCHISTGAIINGTVTVGDRSFVGSGAITIQGANIFADSFLKAGSLFIR